MLNGTMIQFFHWYTKKGLWKHLKEEANKLAELGITAVWMPPAFKGTAGEKSVGYDVYDLYDLGEFNQKGSVATRYGTKQEYLDAIAALHQHKINVIADVVLNHMGGADEPEKVWVKKVDPENRTEFTSDSYEIEAYTKFIFPGRKGKYSQFIWDSKCFTGVDYDKSNNEKAIYSIQNEYGDGWDNVVDEEKGNFDFLMCADIEYRNEAVREEIKRWGKWYLETTGISGLRLDAIKHISPEFISDFLDYMRSLKPDLFAVGEYWSPGNLPLLQQYLEAVGRKMSLFDASLHQNFFEASNGGREYDMSNIFAGSLVDADPELAVTIVDNHDTQPLQTLEAPVEPWFKPLAYALILLREKGYPCVFYPDLYGASYKDKGSDGEEHEIILSKVEELKQLLNVRKLFAYGVQRDYIDHCNCIGWTREGVRGDSKTGCAVILSNGDDGHKKMEIGTEHASKTFIDYMGLCTEEVTVDDQGWGEFYVKGGKVSVWIQKEHKASK